MTLGLAIVGYGKMGRLIEQLAPEYGFEVRAKFDSKNNAGGDGLTGESMRGVDVAVEFSMPHVAAQNIQRLAVAGVNVAVGTTGLFGTRSCCPTKSRLTLLMQLACASCATVVPVRAAILLSVSPGCTTSPRAGSSSTARTSPSSPSGACGRCAGRSR